MSESSRIDCRKCEHFFITWDTHFPSGCRLFGFKSKAQPSMTVFESTGKPCEHFVPDKKRADAAAKTVGKKTTAG